MAKLKYNHITPEIQAKILAFLNEAKTAIDIAGKEPQEGPVFDNPDIGYGDQIRDYDIGELVAGRILAKRDSLRGKVFTKIEQLDDIKGFGQDKLDDMAFSMEKEKLVHCIRIKSWPRESAKLRNEFKLEKPFPVSIHFDTPPLETQLRSEPRVPLDVRMFMEMLTDQGLGFCAKTLDQLCFQSDYQVTVKLLGTTVLNFSLGGGTEAGSKPEAEIPPATPAS